MPRIPALQIEDARIIFPNFAGAEKLPYNAAGDRNFCVIIDEDNAAKLRADGWNVRALKSVDGQPPEFTISVTVKTDSNRPPRLYMVNNRRVTLMNPEEYGVLDYARFSKVDLTINPYAWQTTPTLKVSGYLEEGYFTLEPDRLRDKYLFASENGE